MSKKMPDSFIEILRLIADSKNGLTGDAIIAMCIHSKSVVAKATPYLSNNDLVSIEKIKNKENNRLKSHYLITPKGRDILKNPASLDPTAAKKRTYKARTPAPAPAAPVQANISATANVLADNITAVIEENQQYRNLLLSVYTTIGKSLGLDKDNDNGSSNKD